MPALIRSTWQGRVTWAGLVANRDAALESAPAPAIEARFSGPTGEAHGGLTRPACSRVANLYPGNTEIRNTRQLSILGAEDLDAIAAEMGLAKLDPALVGATLVIAGFPDFTHVPPSSRLQFSSGATLVVDMENRPCTLPAKPIEARHPGHGRAFKPAAAGRRGITAWVEREGIIALGDTVKLFIPDQPAWAGLDP